MDTKKLKGIIEEVLAHLWDTDNGEIIDKALITLMMAVVTTPADIQRIFGVDGKVMFDATYDYDWLDVEQDYDDMLKVYPIVTVPIKSGTYIDDIDDDDQLMDYVSQHYPMLDGRSVSWITCDCDGNRDITFKYQGDGWSWVIDGATDVMAEMMDSGAHDAYAQYVTDWAEEY